MNLCFKIMVCKYFRLYLLNLCSKLIKLDLNGHLVTLCNKKVTTVIGGKKEYDIKKCNDIFNNIKLEFMYIQHTARVKTPIKHNIFGIIKYVKVRSVMYKYLSLFV